MNISALRICRFLGIPPWIWMVHNPIKIYEFLEVTRASELLPTDSILDFGCGSGIWTVAFFAYPLERAVLVLITVLVGVPMVRILKKSLFIVT